MLQEEFDALMTCMTDNDICCVFESAPVSWMNAYLQSDIPCVSEVEKIQDVSVMLYPVHYTDGFMFLHLYELLAVRAACISQLYDNWCKAHPELDKHTHWENDDDFNRYIDKCHFTKCNYAVIIAKTDA